MTQIFTGTGLGLHGSSLGQLSSYGPKGTASLGQGGSSVYVNAANGNLVLKQSDGFLANSDVGLDLFQSYNSRSTGAWRFNTDTRIAFEGKANTTGSIVKRTDEDGHQSCFIYDATQNAYLAEDGSTAKLTFDGTSWSYREGSNQTICHYNIEGQLTNISDHDGHMLRFSYQNGQLTSITDNSNKQTITWSFSQKLLRDITFQSEGQTVHHLHYDYDAQNRLNRVSRDLGDGKTYWTAYDYTGDSNLISDIRQSDGTTLHIDYDAEGRIKRLIDGEGRTTSYDYLTGKTITTNGLGESWTYHYDTDARLTGIDGPENFHIRYHYEGKHLDSITQGNQRWLFGYNDAGDCIRVESPTGEVTLRTYDNEHRILSETHYQTFDGNHHPASPQTSHYVYDEQDHLRYEVTPNGVVTEHRYDANGYRISSRCYMQGRYQDQAITLDALLSWSQLQIQQAISLAEYHYDWRGCLSEEIRYTQINEHGEGISTTDTIRTYSRYDAAAHLIEKSSLTDNGLSTTHFIYDGLGRLIKTIDNQQHTQTFDYDDAHQRILKTDANGLRTLSIYDKSRLLLSTQRLDRTHEYGTTTYRYDAAGRMVAETDVTGKTRHLFYDAQGRLQANVSFNGQVTEYLHDNEGHCIQTHQYQQTVNIANPSSFDAIRPLTRPQDRISQVVYNEYHQIAWQIDADGGVITFQYDAQGRIMAKTACAQRLTNYQPNVPLTNVNIALNPDKDDRTVTYYYDANGRLQAEINGEGAATAYRYDAQGHLVEQIRYKNGCAGQRTGNWATDAPIVSKNQDIHTHSFYNPAGLNVANIDGEGYLTEYVYDSNALLIEIIGYYTECKDAYAINATTTLDTIRPYAHANDHHTIYRYNDLNQRIECSTFSGLVITYAYNEQGLVINETRTDRHTHEARSQQYRYDVLGRIIQSLDAQGVAYLAQHTSLSNDEIESIWQQHGVCFSYDIAGHMVSKTNALNETTRYVYNDAGLLTYTVSPMGAVTETRYNAFQQIETTIRYSAYYSDKAKINLADIKQYMSLLANHKLDQVTHYEYNTLGLLISQQKGSGSTQVTTYNAFGELSQITQRTGAMPDVLTDYQYDRRGLLRYRTEDTGGINKTIEMQYDAFARIEKEWDERHGASIYILSKRGERIRTENQSHGITMAQYDAFGRVLSVTDKARVHYTYDDPNNTLILDRDGLGSRIITQFNAFGDKLSITDANQQTTTYQYDALGQLIHVDAPEHTTIDYTYDATGRLIFQQDEGGHILRFTYDAEGHVLTKTRDPDGLNITTSYTYDAMGRQLQVIDAGRCTQFSYDNQGNLIQTRQDPDGLNLITTLHYNDLGQLIRETRTNPQGVDQITAYTRDALGRCLTRTIDPDGLHFTTTYAYDNNDNLISQTDANQNTTHYVYGLNNRVRYRIDACGVVTEHGYDSKGNEIRTTIYAHRIGLASSYDEATLTRMIQPDPTADHHQFFTFDMQARLTLSYDGAGYATIYRYDANDNVISKHLYDTPCSLNELIKGARPSPHDTVQSRIIYFAYDGLNHERFRVDANGQVTESRYDAAGNLLQKTRYMNRINTPSTTNSSFITSIQAQIKLDPQHDEHTHYTFDQAGRLTLQASAAGVVTAYEYDAAGNQTASHQYATRLTASQRNHPNWSTLIQTSPDDRITRAVFDAAGRAIYRISPTGHVVERRYDAVGNVITEIAHADRDRAHVTQFKYDTAGRLLSQTDAAQHTTRYTYDQNNNVASKTDANNAQWQYRYNATNQLIETISPSTTFSTYTNGVWREETRAIITHNEYDSFGNLISDIHDAGGINQTIHYTYDANNRKLQTIYPNVTISNNRTDIIKTLTETSVYNAFGELIEQQDRAGHSRHYAYDRAGQQVYAVSAEGGVTQYKYDSFGNVITKTSYATRLNTNDYSLNGIATAMTINTDDRHEYYIYDQDHRLFESRKDPILMFNPRTGDYHTLSPITRLTYNAFGDTITQAIQLSDIDWAITTHTYDNDGLKTATLDAEQYLTTYRYNAFGLLDAETQYATRGAQPNPSPKDRKVTFLYNAKGQLIQKTLKDVTVSRLTGNGTQYETLTRDLTSDYGYDAMGNMVSTTDPEGHTAYSYYNTQGQLTAKVGMVIKAGRAATTYRYDALGQLVESHQWENGAQISEDAQLTLNSASNNDIILRDVYDANGHVTEKINGTGHVTHFSYDANGNVARSWQLLKQANATTLMSDKHYVYDRENHLIQTATLNAAGQQATDDAQYNAFGEVIKKGLDGLFATQIDYDNSGRVWRSNTQGYFQIYVYDLSDHVTQIATSTNAFGAEYGEKGVDLSNHYYDNVSNLNGDASLYDLQHQDNTYDALGRLIGQARDATIGNLDKYNKVRLPRFTQAQTVDRWGNILLHTNARGYTTRYDYNALNALTEQILPEVTTVDEHGVARTLAPVNHYAIDSLGHTIAMTDANGHTIAHRYDAEGRITQDIDASGNHRDKTYNLLGQLTTQTNERSGITSYTYDGENRLLSVTTAQTAQRYEYDGAGQVIRQTDAAGNVQTMAYNELGHLIQKTAQNSTTHYEYDTAGHKTAEHDANGNTSTWRYDEHGRLREHTDLGGHHTEYTYNRNGLLLTEQSTSGKNIVNHYYSDGKIVQFVDNTSLEVVNFSYDAEGNILSKMTSRPGDWIPETDHYEYDALDRITHVKRIKPNDTTQGVPTPDRTMLSIDYAFDAVGNIRNTNVTANYTGYQATSHTDYFRYDENNRMTVNKGQLINGQIDITSAQGTSLAYDETGNIADAKTFEGGILQHYAYRYNTDNLLEITRKNERDFQTKRYDAGLLREETLYNDNGQATQHNTLFYENGRLSGQITKDVNQTIVSETGYQYDRVGNITTLTTKGTGYTQTHQYDYERWDGYLQKTDNLILAADGHATSYGKSTHSYDLNGLLQDVENSQAPNNKTHYFASNLDGIRARKDNTGQTSYLTIGGKTIGDLRLDKQDKQYLNVYGPSALPDTQQDNLGACTLNAGDTLDSIALQIYGDSSLWYLIADANGITDRTARAGEKGSQLHAGLRLNLPSVTKGQHNTSTTHNVLSSTDWTGDTTAIASPLVALTPAPPPHQHHHNSFWKTIAKITVVITAAVAMVMSAGALAVLAGATVTGLGSLITTGLAVLGGTASLGLTPTLAISFAAGFTSSIAGQTAANLLHQQNGIDMKSALLSGLGTAATAGVSHLLNASKAYAALRTTIESSSPPAFNVMNAAEMMERDSVSQALNLALTHHQHFDWMELGVSAVTAGVMGGQTAQSLNNKLEEKLGRLSTFATSELQALATGAATGNFDAAQILQDNLGNAVSSTLLQPSKPLESTASDNESNIESTLDRHQRESNIRQRLEQMEGQYMNEMGSSNSSASNSTESHSTSMLGSLSMKYETGIDSNEYLIAAGTVSSGKQDNGGLSYGAYQLSSLKNQVQKFLQYEGAPWAGEFNGLDATHSGAFGEKWKKIAKGQGESFFTAQHKYIERTHYEPVVKYLQKQTGLNINTQPAAVKDAIWSASVQHGRAKYFLVDAINSVQSIEHSNAKYAPALLHAIYDKRKSYVSSLDIPNKNMLLTKRYPDELQRALNMLKNR